MSDDNYTLPDVPMAGDIVEMHEQVTGGLHHIIEMLVNLVDYLGYPGIFIMTFLESTFMPIPSEITMIPAGYLVQQGELNLFWVLVASITGTIGGALFNYYIAYHYGRRFLYAYGRYFFFGHDKMEKLDRFFASHGEISTFTGRLVPGLRHFISFPAGLAHMDLKKFVIYTGTGGAIWMATLTGVGYFIGGNKELVKQYMPLVTTAAICTVVLMIVVYVGHKRGMIRRIKKTKEKTDGMA